MKTDFLLLKKLLRSAVKPLLVAPIRADKSPHKEIPSPFQIPALGSTLSLIASGGAKRLHEYAHRRHKELGPIFRDRVGPGSLVFVSDPDGIREVFRKEGKYPHHIIPEAWLIYNKIHGTQRGLLFMNGETWLYYRRIMNELLLKGSPEWIESSCIPPTESFIRRIHNSNKTSPTFPNIIQELFRWSLDVLVSVSTGPDFFQKNYDQLSPILEKCSRSCRQIMLHTSKMQTLPASLAYKFQLKCWAEFETSFTESLKDARHVVTYLLSQKTNGLLDKLINRNLNEEEITSIICDLVLAAGDTSANTIQWILFCLANHKEVQDNIRGLDDIERKRALKRVIKETLRLYPTAPFITRYMQEDTEIMGYRIPAQTLVVMSMCTSGRDPQVFSESDKFDPERWVKTKNLTMQNATLPFAFGARSCVGKKVAEMEMVTLLDKILQNFEVELMNEKKVEYVLEMIGVPSEELQLKFSPLR